MNMKGMCNRSLIDQFPNFGSTNGNILVNHVHIKVGVVDHEGTLNSRWSHVLGHEGQYPGGIRTGGRPWLMANQSGGYGVYRWGLNRSNAKGNEGKIGTIERIGTVPGNHLTRSHAGLGCTIDRIG